MMKQITEYLPMFEDGQYVNLGDEYVDSDGDACVVERITIRRGAFEPVLTEVYGRNEEGILTVPSMSDGKVKRPRPRTCMNCFYAFKNHKGEVACGKIGPLIPLKDREDTCGDWRKGPEFR